jgi:hypothetical protein
MKALEAPNLASIKEFLRFYVATCKGVIAEKVTSDSTNTFAEWFFAGFTRVTGTPVAEEDRKEVYKVGDRPPRLESAFSQLSVGSPNTHQGGSGGEQEAAETQFLCRRSHPHFDHVIDEGRPDLHSRTVPATVHVHFSGLLLDGGQDRSILHGRPPLPGGFPGPGFRSANLISGRRHRAATQA